MAVQPGASLDTESVTIRQFQSPLLLLASSFALGILIVHAEHKPLAQTIETISLLLALAGVFLLAGLLTLRAGRAAASALLALMGFVAAGSASSLLFEARFSPHHVRYLSASAIDLAAPIRLEGFLISTPLRSPYGLQFDIEATTVAIQHPESGASARPAEGKVRLRLEASNDPSAWAEVESLHLQEGDLIRAPVHLLRPTTYNNPGSFDYRWWMKSFEDIYWIGTIKSPLLVEKLPGTSKRGLPHVLERTRQRLIRAIDNMYPPWSSNMRYGAVLKAVLLGERASLDSDTIEGFRRSGLYHLLVIAGLHIGLLALIVSFILRRLPLSATWRSACLLIFLVAYAGLVEQRSATLRATVMIFAYLVARLLYRERVLLNAIGLAALLLLLHRPVWLLESGFQLSFSAVLLIAGLVAPILMRTTEPLRRALWNIDDINPDIHFAPRQAQFRLDVRDLIGLLKRRTTFMERHPAFASAAVTSTIRVAIWTANILLFSAILQIGLLLPMAETFHRVTIAGIALNALAIPVMVVLLVAAVPTVLLATLAPALAVWPSRALALILKLLFALTEFPSLAHWLSYRIPEPPTWVAFGFVFSAIIAAVVLAMQPRSFWVPLAGLVLFAGLVSLHPFGPRLPTGVLELTALDCGGGDSVFVVLPDRTTMLIDAGGSRARRISGADSPGRRWDPGEDIVSPYLWSRGIQKVDIVVVSDTREDLTGMAAIIRNFKVGEIWSGANSFVSVSPEWMDAIRRRGIPIRQMAAGDSATRGTASILALSPARGQVMLSDSGSEGDEPLVLRISDRDGSALLSSDSSAGLESELAESSSFQLKSQVLKVSRRRTKTSSMRDFFGRVYPQVALVSAEGTERREPNSEMLSRLRSLGARVYRTDFSGAITVVMQGGSLAVHTYGAAPDD